MSFLFSGSGKSSWRSSKGSRRGQQQVTIIRAVNGGSIGHHSSGRRKQLSHPKQPPGAPQKKNKAIDFWSDFDESEFLQQEQQQQQQQHGGAGSTTTAAALMMNDKSLLGLTGSSRRRQRTRQSSTETQRTRQSSTQTAGTRSDPDQENNSFWRTPYDERDDDDDFDDDVVDVDAVPQYQLQRSVLIVESIPMMAAPPPPPSRSNQKESKRAITKGNGTNGIVEKQREKIRRGFFQRMVSKKK